MLHSIGLMVIQSLPTTLTLLWACFMKVLDFLKSIIIPSFTLGRPSQPSRVPLVVMGRGLSRVTVAMGSLKFNLFPTTSPGLTLDSYSFMETRGLRLMGGVSLSLATRRLLCRLDHCKLTCLRLVGVARV